MDSQWSWWIGTGPSSAEVSSPCKGSESSNIKTCRAQCSCVPSVEGRPVQAVRPRCSLLKIWNQVGEHCLLGISNSLYDRSVSHRAYDSMGRERRLQCQNPWPLSDGLCMKTDGLSSYGNHEGGFFFFFNAHELEQNDCISFSLSICDKSSVSWFLPTLRVNYEEKNIMKACYCRGGVTSFHLSMD